MVVEAQPVAERSVVLSSGDAKATRVKPRLRGIPDVFALFLFVPAATVLMTQARPGVATVAAAIYGLTLIFLFAVSAAYHTPHWPVHLRGLWRRLDHSAIYVLLIGCYTPVCLLALPQPQGRNFLGIVVTVSVLGILKSVLWPTSPRALNTLLYVVAGCLILPYFWELRAGLGPESTNFMALGGVLYAVGAVVYVRRWPNPVPSIFGYHEVFHLFVVAAAICQYAAFYRLLTG